MKVPKEKIYVNIVCNDGTSLEGFIHIREGLRMLDDLNNSKENFVAITNVKSSNVKTTIFGLHKDIFKKKEKLIILNKNLIKWMKEI